MALAGSNAGEEFPFRLYVTPEDEAVEALAPPPPKPKPVNWVLIGGIIAEVVVVGLLIFFLIRRRAY